MRPFVHASSGVGSPLQLFSSLFTVVKRGVLSKLLTTYTASGRSILSELLPTCSASIAVVPATLNYFSSPLPPSSFFISIRRFAEQLKVFEVFVPNCSKHTPQVFVVFFSNCSQLAPHQSLLYPRRSATSVVHCRHHRPSEMAHTVRK